MMIRFYLLGSLDYPLHEAHGAASDRWHVELYYILIELTMIGEQLIQVLLRLELAF